MVFSTYTFLLIFLPSVLLIYFGLARFVSRKVQHIFLILASFVFYGYSNISYIWLILASIITNYALATAIQKAKKKGLQTAAFTIAVLFNIALLGYYKYYNFFIENLNSVFDTDFVLKQIILPIGISFFTFQQLIFLLNIKKKEEQVPSFLDYTLFVTFFPELVAGPIVLAKDMLPQYKDEKNRFFNIDNFSAGIFIFVLGLFKKVVIADTIGPLATNGFYSSDTLSFGGAWVTSLLYTFRIYFDFSGYSEMAIGLAKMLNINLPVNFYSPYKSKSITEFWKRWHITLGRSLAILVYFPLGGSRKGLPRTCLNLFIVFLVSGIWHGAAWVFIIWGILHGIVRVFEKLFDKQLDKIPALIRIFFTFMFVNAAWVLFASPKFDVAITILKKMFLPTTISFEGIGLLTKNTTITYPSVIQIIYVLVWLAFAAAIVFLLPKNTIDRYNAFKPKIKNAVIVAILLSISIVHFSKAAGFIYFNF